MNSAKERVLVVIKPDGMRKILAGDVLNRFLFEGMELVAAKAVLVSPQLAQTHYACLRGLSHFQKAVDFLSENGSPQGKLLAFVFAGENAVARARQIAGATNPEEALPTTIRGAYGRITTNDIYENVVHVSSDKKEAEREIKIWFSSDEAEK